MAVVAGAVGVVVAAAADVAADDVVEAAAARGIAKRQSGRISAGWRDAPVWSMPKKLALKSRGSLA